ncbi:hypothetical protein FQN54_003154 [Arachnomyces sp. PD_36]|nr:hypothetical protein FQN54_003154 [Arachnomyces sp. PD_36]
MARRRSDFQLEFHGQKRPADDELEGEQPLTKKLGRLHIGGHPPRLNGDGPATRSDGAKGPSTSQRSPEPGDSMLLDDTKDTIYIHDLEKELEDIEAEEQNVAFLPEIEKRLTAIPKSVLRDEKPTNSELVLYRLPTSLTVSEDKDSVRRAIADTRKRAREAESHQPNLNASTKPSIRLEEPMVDSQNASHIMASDNDDAMDLDDV